MAKSDNISSRRERSNIYRRCYIGYVSTLQQLSRRCKQLPFAAYERLVHIENELTGFDLYLHCVRAGLRCCVVYTGSFDFLIHHCSNFAFPLILFAFIVRCR